MTTYEANIFTSEVKILREPEVTVMTKPQAHPTSEFVISYPLVTGADEASGADVLRDHGWKIVGEAVEVEAGWTIVEVRPHNWETLVREATGAYAEAQNELDRRYEAWQTVVRDAMNDDLTIKTRIAEAAGVSRDRAYKIRDGRR